MSPQDFLKKGAERGHYGAERAKLAQQLFNAYCRADQGNRNLQMRQLLGDVHYYAKEVGGWDRDSCRQMFDNIRASMKNAVEGL